MIFTLANDRFIVCPSSVTLTFNLPEQMWQNTSMWAVGKLRYYTLDYELIAAHLT